MKSPFKFLDSYTKDDRDIFFGRDRETEELYQRVFESKLLLVYGVSGTGKSSLIHCGLANKFQVTDWLPLVIRRGANIVRSTAEAIKTASLTPQENRFITPADFRKGVKSLYLDHYKPVFFVFDQFEELFIFGDKEERNSFIGIIKNLIEADLQCRLIFVMREEYMAAVTEFEKPIPSIFSNRVRIEKMSHRNALSAVREPCRVFGIEMEEGFAENLLEKLSPESSDVELTYLQVFLDKVFRLAQSEQPEGNSKIFFTNNLLERTGNVSDLLGSFLEEQISLLDNADEALAVLKSFVSVKGTKRQMTPGDVSVYTKSMGKVVESARLQEMIQTFINLRILRDKDQYGKYELRHDALATKIWEKITLVEKEILEIRQFIENAFNTWEKRGVVLSADDLNYIAPYESRLFLTDQLSELVDESKKMRDRARRRTRSIALTAAVTLLLIFAGFTIWALKERSSAIAQSKHSKALSLAAMARETFMDNPTRSLRLARLAYDYDSINYTVNQTLNEIFHNTVSYPLYHASLRHNESVLSGVFSPDGMYLLTSSKDGTAKKWNLSGRCLITYSGHAGGVGCATFSPDGKTVLTSSVDRTAKLWDEEGKCMVTFTGHQAEVLGAAFSPDGKHIVTYSTDRTAKVWDLTGRCTATLSGHTAIIESAIFSPDGKSILTSADDMTAKLWDTGGRCLVTFAGHSSANFSSVYSAIFSPDGTRVLTSSADGTAKMWDLSGRCLTTFAGHIGSVYNALFSPEGDMVLTSGFDNTAKLWNLKGECLVTYAGHTEAVYEAHFSPDGTKIVTSSADKTAKVWDLVSGYCTATLSGHASDIYTAVFSPDGRWIVTVPEDLTAKVWDMSVRGFSILRGHVANVYVAVFSPDAKTILTASDDLTTKLWDSGGNCLATMAGHRSIIFSACYAPDGKTILTSSADRTAKLWDLSGRCLLTLEGHADNVITARFSPDGKKIVTGSRDMTSKIWDLSGNCLVTMSGHTNAVYSAAYSPDGQTILTASSDMTARIWDLSGKCLQVLQGHAGPIGSAVFSPDGQTILTASFDFTAKLWNRSGECLTTYAGHQGPVYSASFSPDGRHVVTASMDRTAKLFDLSGNSLATLSGHSHDVLSATFSPDAKEILTSSADRTAKIWDLNGRCLTTLTGHSGEVYSARYSPDGKVILTASADDNARIWLTQPTILGWIRVTQFGNLTPADRAEIEEPVDFKSLARSEDISMLTEYADWYLSQTDTAKAIMLYERALMSDPKSFDRKILGNLYRATRKTDEYRELFKDEPQVIIKNELQALVDTTSEGNVSGKFAYYSQRTQLYERLLSVEYVPVNRTDAAINYLNLGWYSLLAGRYPTALEAINRGIALDPENQYLYTNLPLCYLFNGQTVQAKATYMEWKDKPWIADDGYKTFREAFLSDIGYLESIGLHHPDFAEMKQILNK